MSVAPGGEGQDGRLELASVAGEVVATQHGHGSAPPSTALGEAMDEPSDRRTRMIRLGQIMDNIWMRFIEPALGRQSIAFLGDCQTDHMDFGRGQRRQDLRWLRHCGEGAANDANNAVLRRLR